MIANTTCGNTRGNTVCLTLNNVVRNAHGPADRSGTARALEASLARVAERADGAWTDMFKDFSVKPSSFASFFDASEIPPLPSSAARSVLRLTGSWSVSSSPGTLGSAFS